jgi:pyrophosphate--fructose-6-phosphate 1-phosphotransferase
MVKAELAKRKSAGSYKGSFSAQPLFCGYEGRSCMPSNFDSDYCYALGHVAALLINYGATGYMSCVKNLKESAEKWEIAGIPLVSMMDLEERMGKKKPVIKKALVRLDSPAFLLFKKMRKGWGEEDCYRNPGPIQFFGPTEITDSRPLIF